MTFTETNQLSTPGSKVRVIKRFRYSTRIFDIGEVGTVVNNGDYPLIWKGDTCYLCYVQFQDHKPIGVYSSEIELAEDI